MSEAYAAELSELLAIDREARVLEHAAAVLSWDQETYMPARAVGDRAAQLSALHGLAHERSAAPRVGELIDSLRARGVAAADAPFLRAKERQYRRNCKIPTALVRALAETTSHAQAAWVRAREQDAFVQFLPHLERIIALNQELADHLGYETQRYDALLDQYEPYTLTAEVAALFNDLEQGLVPLVQAIAAAPKIEAGFLHRHFPQSDQESFSVALMTALGYELERGRLDRSAHPFTTTLGMDDVRITTRYDERFLPSALFGTIHETGHALYELGFDRSYGGTILAEGTSLGIHESQSRLWENMIGRSRPFWHHWLPRLKQLFPTQLDGVSLESFYRGINRVAPSLIRVEADEVTYSLHVILRFRIEQALIAGDLAAAEAPEAWRDLSRRLLGIVPSTDREGVLQDIHWSMGGFGYFPTYALGNLYAAQFLRRLEEDVPALWSDVEAGQTASILAWLRDRIHRHGRARTASELVQEITGAPLSAAVFLSYLRGKYGDIYAL